MLNLRGKSNAPRGVPVPGAVDERAIHMNKPIIEPSNVVYGLFCVCHSCIDLRGNEIMYAGKTVNRPSKRLRGHVSKARMGDSRPVSNWIRKHGPENIRYSILEVVAEDGDLYAREQWWIRHLNTVAPNGYNLTDGGPGSTGMSFSDDRRKNIGDGRRGGKVNAVALAELRESLTNNRKLRVYDVVRIKQRLWDGESQNSVARDYDVTSTVIARIDRDESFSDIPWPQDRPRNTKTRLDKVREAAAKRKGVKRDVRIGRAKAFSESPMLVRDIRRIRDLSRSTRMSHKEIADHLPDYVTTAIVGKIIRGERWAWVD